MNIVFAIVLVLAGAGCIKRTVNPELKKCEETVNKLGTELQQKNERLRAFNQLGADGELRQAH